MILRLLCISIICELLSGGFAISADGGVLKDCAECPRMVKVPAGSFRMGSSTASGHASERPQHDVKFDRPFAVGQFEITFEEWDACVEAGGCQGYSPSDNGWGRGALPVINVNLSDINSYIEWISNITGRKYFLLSEAQWEYAARADTNSEFFWGDERSSLFANFSNADHDHPKKYRTMPVGSFLPNQFNIYDTSGNVAEIVRDCYVYGYEAARYDGEPREEGDCEHVIRGGSWADDVSFLRSSSRARDVTGGRSGYGFRLGRVLTDSDLTAVPQ